MKVVFLGTGSAFTTKNYQTNTLIVQNDKGLLIDAGGDIRWSLKEFQKTYLDIDAIYITHLHADHIGGLEYFAFCSYFDPRMAGRKIKLFANINLIEELWESSLKGGLKCIQGKTTNLYDFFDVKPLPKNGVFTWEDIRFETVQSVHVMDKYSIVSSFGLMFADPNSNKKIYYTGDTQFNPNQIVDFYMQADVIIQDCETSPFKSGVHANYEELKTLSPEIKKKMVLFHYNDNIMNELGKVTKDWETKCNDDGFGAFLEKGTILSFDENSEKSS